MNTEKQCPSELNSAAARTVILPRTSDALRNEASGVVTTRPTLTEDEFVLRVLKDFDLVDDELVDEIKDRFQKILERANRASSDPPRTQIDLQLVFSELVALGRVRDSNRLASGIGGSQIDKAMHLLHARSSGGQQSPRKGRSQSPLKGRGSDDKAPSRKMPPHNAAHQHQKAPRAGPMVVDMATQDQGFGEWLRRFWLQKLRAARRQGHSKKDGESGREDMETPLLGA